MVSSRKRCVPATGPSPARRSCRAGSPRRCRPGSGWVRGVPGAATLYGGTAWMDGSWWKILFIMENPWKIHENYMDDLGYPHEVGSLHPHVELEMMIPEKKYDPVL